MIINRNLINYRFDNKKLNRKGFQTTHYKDLKSDYLLPSYTYWNSRLDVT